MRKLWCAGAIASGFLLLGAAPALADETVAPGAGSVAGSARGALSSALGYALEPTNGWKLGSPLASDPLSGQPMVQLEPGPGRHLAQLAPGTPQTEDAKPAKNRKSKAAGQGIVPAADVLRTVPGAAPGSGGPTDGGSDGPLGGLPVQGVPMPLAGQDLRVANVPVDGLVGRTLSGFGGLTPAGVPSTPGTRTPAPDERPIATPRLERDQADFPLLGGLGGALPVSTLQREITDFQSEFTGMPFGGSPLRTARSANTVPDDGAGPAATPAPVASPAPATAAPSASATDAGGAPATPAQSSAPGFSAGENPQPAGEQVIDDPRLHEEPIDGFVAPDKK
ncbi:hypothetical protein QLQ12_35130 [Actinoplanes sp. NEAU-A12]|uniref:Secreted protein n=1 Tax=Actinoplanes sandaracinus TaxID=3045177 RepID=A0ABT6WVU5_9ACTN|nr:hypothetical protein [Actinoplanes sandaracinus]MDI6103861.1 hypothetical protein [Actinoplanes sandaracinus]